MSAAFPLVRKVSELREREFDLLVVGGGIYGAWAAYDAAQRGLSVALIEQNDWGSATSQASSKLIHGGLRYLENFEFGLVRHALIERRVLARVAPHLVHPMNFILPLWKGARVSAFKLGAGLTIYDWLSIGWQPVQRHKHFKRDRLMRRYPFLASDGLEAGFRYGDCQEDDARLVIPVVAAAQQHGAVCANRVAATRLFDEDGRCGAEVTDRETGERFAIRARTQIATVGPWVRELAGADAPRVKLVKGTHLVMPGIPNCHSAFLLTAPQDGRVFFVIPWYHRTLVGTTESEIGHPDEAVPNDEEQRYLLSAAQAWLPGVSWRPEHVISRFAGTRTLQAQEAGTLSKVSREFEILEPRPGLFVPIGGKYTTARHDASRVVDRVCRNLGQKLACKTDELRLPGAPAGDDFAGWQADAVRRLRQAGVDTDAARQLSLRHGTAVERALDLIAAEPALAERLDADSPFIGVEAVMARLDEMARDFDDVTRRRIPLQILARSDGAWRARTEDILARL